MRLANSTYTKMVQTCKSKLKMQRPSSATMCDAPKGPSRRLPWTALPQQTRVFLSRLCPASHRLTGASLICWSGTRSNPPSPGPPPGQWRRLPGSQVKPSHLGPPAPAQKALDTLSCRLHRQLCSRPPSHTSPETLHRPHCWLLALRLPPSLARPSRLPASYTTARRACLSRR